MSECSWSLIDHHTACPSARTLAEFFTSCISNPLSEQVLVPTLEGLTALAKMPHFGPLETTNLSKAYAMPRCASISLDAAKR